MKNLNGAFGVNSIADGAGIHENGAPTRYKARQPDGHPEPAREMLSELRNHQHLLAEILRPICHGRKVMLKPAEKRMLERLLADTSELLLCLEHLLITAR